MITVTPRPPGTVALHWDLVGDSDCRSTGLPSPTESQSAHQVTRALFPAAEIDFHQP